MNRYTFALASLVMLLAFITVPLATANERFVQEIENSGRPHLGIQATDGSYVTVAYFVGNDLLVQNTHHSGKNLWSQHLQIGEQVSFGGYTNPTGIAETTDRGFVLIGESKCGTCAEIQSFIIKLNEAGKLKWKKGFEITSPNYFRFESVISAPDGGFIIVVGGATENKSLIRFTAAGDVLWENSFSLDANYFLDSVSSNDNGLVLFYTTEGGIRILKFDYFGNSVWERKLEIPFFTGFPVRVGSTHNGFVVAGSVRSDLFLIGLKTDGELAWKKAYTTGIGDGPFVTDVRQSPNKSLVVTALVYNSALLLKIDSSREIIFQNHFPNLFGKFFLPRFSFDTPDGGFMLFGSSAYDDPDDGLLPEDDQFILKLDSKGKSASCMSVKSVNLVPTAFPSVKSISGTTLRSSPSIALRESALSLNSVSPQIRLTTKCKSPK